MESITANEIAGLGVGALLLAAALATPKVDSFVARGQRRLCLIVLVDPFFFFLLLTLTSGSMMFEV